MHQKSSFHKQIFPEKIHVQLQFPRSHSIKTPDIMISSSGELTPFLLQFGTNEQPNLVQLIGKHNGELRLKNAATSAETP